MCKLGGSKLSPGTVFTAIPGELYTELLMELNE